MTVYVPIGGGSSTLAKYSSYIASNVTCPPGGSVAICNIAAVPAGVYLVNAQVTLSGATSIGNCDILMTAPGLGSGCGSNGVVITEVSQIEMSAVVTTLTAGLFALSVQLASGVTGTVVALATGPISLNSQLSGFTLVKIG